MNEITFGKNRYHQQRDMEEWCQKNIGKGLWIYGRPGPETWEGMGNNLWAMWTMFGNTTFVFKNARDYTFFLLKWS